MSLASGREKRVTAGARMARLLDEEEEDDFYKTTYGGFEEEECDNDYHSENSESDFVDSDFDIDEQDEVKSDMEDEGEGKRKRKGIDTKAYKEPAVKKSKKDAAKPKPKPSKPRPKPDRSAVQIYHAEPQRKTLRQSTKSKSQATEDREKERVVREKNMKEVAARKNVSEVRRLTQKELLEEAKMTERINLKSLENYQRLELERKKNRVQKSAYRGPIIRYHSVTMPLIQELPGDEIHVDSDSDVETQKPQSKEKCSRTFITFTEDKTFKDYFPCKKSRPPSKLTCAVTGHPARYMDPITDLPFANAHAFKVIREAYQQQVVEVSGERTKRHSRTPQKLVEAV